MPIVKLLYAPDCPHVSLARERLRQAYEALGATPTWTEVNLCSDRVSDDERGYGSPTILIDGKDITGTAPGGGSSCRIYADSDVRGVPPLDIIVAALQASSLCDGDSSWR